MTKQSLTKEKLASYVETNTPYYEKYLDTFKQKEKFYSWNWVALFIPQIWLPYRKLWGDFIVLFLFVSASMFALYMSLVYPRDFPYEIMIAIAPIALAFLIYFPLTANRKVLARASLYSDTHETGKSHWLKVVLAAIIFSIPINVFVFKFGAVVKIETDNKTIHYLEGSSHSTDEMKEMINNLSADSNQYLLPSKIVCNNDTELLEFIASKDLIFEEDDLVVAYKCNAEKSITYLLDHGIASNPELVIDAIINAKLPMVKLLLKNDPNIQQVFLVAAIRHIEDKTIKDNMVAFLLSKNVDLSVVELDNSGDKTISALKAAIDYNDLKSATLFLEKGANPNAELDHIDTLLNAARRQSLDIFKLLLTYKADPNTILYSNDTLLDRLVEYNQLDRVKIMLDAGALVSEKTLEEAQDVKYSHKVNHQYYDDDDFIKNKKIIQLLNSAYKAQHK